MTEPRRPSCCDRDRSFLEFDGLSAEDDLRRWRAGRLNPATRELIEVTRAAGVAGARVLDVGAGVGAVHVALLEAGAAEAIDVDASREYLAAARVEAERRGLAGRVEYRYGDVVELADELPPVDVVTMDSAICCYPDLEPMLEAATRSKPTVVGITYPRDTWWMRAYMRLYNRWQRVRRSNGRYFVHRHARLEHWMADAGYRNAHEGGIRPWRVVLYRRVEPGG